MQFQASAVSKGYSFQLHALQNQMSKKSIEWNSVESVSVQYLQMLRFKTFLKYMNQVGLRSGDETYVSGYWFYSYASDKGRPYHTISGWADS